MTEVLTRAVSPGASLLGSPMAAFYPHRHTVFPWYISAFILGNFLFIERTQSPWIPTHPKDLIIT